MVNWTYNKFHGNTYVILGAPSNLGGIIVMFVLVKINAEYIACEDGRKFLWSEIFGFLLQ